MLTSDEQRRYARAIQLPEIGEAGQKRLRDARVLVIGAGGLGAASLSYLAAAGIGTLGIVDHDAVELSNLGRQIIHEQGDIGRKKVESAADRIGELNPFVIVEPHFLRLNEDSATALIHAYDLVIDGSDNFPTRLLVNATCHTQRRTLISAAVRGWHAQMSTFTSYLGAPHPCYQCLVTDAPPGRNDCAEHGVAGPLVGIAGSMQAMEAIKELLGIGNSLSGRLLRFDALNASWQESSLIADPECFVCSAT